MKKILFYLSPVLILASCVEVSAQGSAPPPAPRQWKPELTASLSLTQASFNNWAQGGESSLAWQVGLNPALTLNRPGYTWSSKARFTYGLSRVGDLGARKSADEIRLESVYTRQLGTMVNPFFSVTALTQFSPGYKYGQDTKTQVSDFMDPGYFTQSAGVGYAVGETFKTRLGATLKETFTRHFPAPYTDNPQTSKIEKRKVEGGITSTTEFNRNLNDNLAYSSELVLFSNLKGFAQVYMKWSNLLTAKVAKIVSVTLSMDMLYDKTVIDKLQTKELLALGLSYTYP